MQKTTDKTPPKTDDNLLLRYVLQDAAARLLPGERVAVCLRWRAPVNPAAGKSAYIWPTADVFYNSGTERASYRNLIVCNRLWVCPVCAARISEQRRTELATAAENSDYGVVMLTLTMRHTITDNLSSMVAAITGVYRALKSGRWWQDVKHEYGVIGDVRALEITYGEHGWHVHIHALVFTERALTDHDRNTLEHAVKTRYLETLRRTGYEADWQHGAWLTAEHTYIHEYLAKFGRLPKINLDGSKWTIYHELTKSNQKRARSTDGLTPFGLLLAYVSGDKQAGIKFVEYARVFKGYHQLQWSRGLKHLLHIDEVPDADAGTDSDAGYVMSVESGEWDEIARAGLRAQLLRATEQFHGDAQRIRAWLGRAIDYENREE